MRILYLDCFSGASGDMLLGALSEICGDFEVLRAGLEALGFPSLGVRRSDVMRAGVGATKIDVLVEGISGLDAGLVERTITTEPPAHSDHHHSHDAGEHAHSHDSPAPPGGSQHRHASQDVSEARHSHRTLGEIERIISDSRLSSTVKDRSIEVFRRLVTAEAEVHRIPPREVHLHEAGAADAIADVVGSVILLEAVSPDRTVASAVNVGGGTVKCEHGLYPVPAPATALLLRGIPIYSSGPDGELVTPTGAALLATLVDEFGPIPSMVPSSIGLGAGGRDTSPRPNVLRAFFGEATVREGEGEVVVIECTIDDMNPQIYGYVLDRLTAAGALEAYLTPVHMKKNRPGVQITALCDEASFPQLSSVLFAESTTIGFRYRRERRRELTRAVEEVSTPYGAVRVKISSEAGTIRSVQPEYEDCRRLADGRAVPLKEVQASALAAWRRSRGEETDSSAKPSSRPAALQRKREAR